MQGIEPGPTADTPNTRGHVMNTTLQIVSDIVWPAERATRHPIPRPSPAAANVRRYVLLWLWGVLALGIVTLACFKLGFDESTAKCVFLTAVVFLSLMDSLITSLFLCVVATLYIDYFFTEPIYRFHLPYSADLPSLSSFVAASLVIAGLVRHIRKLSDTRRDQAMLLDLSRDTVVVRDMEGRITYWNRGAASLYGWSVKEAVGKAAHTLLHTEFPVPFETIHATLLTAGAWEGELQQTLRDGKKVIVSSRWTLHRDEAGRPCAILESGNDITDYKRAEEVMRRTQLTYLEEAQSLSLTGSFGWNANTGEIHWSGQTFRLFEYDPAVTPTFDMLMRRVYPDDRERVSQAFNRLTRANDDLDCEYRLQMPDGSIKIVRMVIHASTRNDSHREYIGAVSDITAARNAEFKMRDTLNELARVSRATTLNGLSSSIAHEVKQPLTAIVVQCDAGRRWLNRPNPNIGEVADCLTQVLESAQRAAAIIERIRLMTTKGATQRAPLKLNDVVREAIELTEREVEDHQVSLEVVLEPSLPALLGDGVQLQQILVNLILNAVQSMDVVEDRPRELLVESRLSPKGLISLSVRDSGTGISPDNLPRLFDAFFSTKQRGMGMGLSICRSIVDAHGGAIDAYNNDQHGATFLCTFPPIDLERAVGGDNDDSLNESR